MKRRTLFAAALAAGAAAIIGTAEAEEPLKLRIGWAQAPGHMAPLLYQNKAILKHFGKSYVAEPTRFQGSTPQIQAIASGELEIAAFGAPAMVLAITNARQDVRVVADVIQDGVPGYYTAPFLVKKNGPVKTVQDLKGKRVATNAIGSASDAALRIYLRRHGLQDRDFTSVEANFANMPAMIADGKVDMISLQPQFAHGFIETGEYIPLFTTKDAIGVSQIVFWAMRADVIAKNRPALVDFFEDHIRAMRWFLDPRNHAQAVDIAAAALKAPRETLDYAFTKADFYRSPDARPMVDAVQRDVADAVELGVLKESLPIAPNYVDLSLIEEAKKRIDG
ncbi:MAG TPA: ABC transporter substrate-binding protein [Alphaproteobacteria bacterium]